MGGACLGSGNMDTGQMLETFGGGQVFTSFSGVVVDTVVQSGPGRLDTVMAYATLLSGRGVIFYDSAVATSGGPFSASGHKVVGVISPAWNQSASGFLNNVGAGEPMRPGMPFFSGLVAAPGVGGSGGPSWTISYTVASVVSGTPVGGP